MKAISKNQKAREGPINAPGPIRDLPFQNTRSQDLPEQFDLEEVHPDEVLEQLNDDDLDFLEDEDDFVEPVEPMARIKQTKRKQTPAARAAAAAAEQRAARDRSPVAGPSRALTPPPSASKRQRVEDVPLPVDSDDEEMPAAQRQTNMASGGAPAQMMSNMWFDGFGEYTSPDGQVFTTYKRTYKKSYKCHCKFEGESSAQAYITDAQDVPVYVNHGGNTFPYWYRRASCNDEEFNQPDNVLGFRCTRMGFSVPRLELATIPNNKTSENEVPMPTPMHAEMWTFLDVNNDYGIPIRHEDHSHAWVMAHNYDFTDYFKGEVPVMRSHCQMWDKDMLLNLNRDNITYEGVENTMSFESPWDIYDLKRHPGYRSVPATDATAFALEFTPKEQKWTFFPHTQVVDLNASRGAEGIVDSSDWAVWSENAGKQDNLLEWPVNYIQTPYDAKVDGHAHSIANKVRLAHLSNTEGLYASNTLRWRNPKRAYGYKKAGKDDFAISDLSLDATLGGYAVTQHNISGLTSDGEANTFQHFPLFMFGVHPDYERKANGVLPYNYFANINVTYFSDVEWLIATPAPSYLPIGPGGCDGRTVHTRHMYNDKGFADRVLARTTRRRVMGKIKGNHYIGGVNFI